MAQYIFKASTETKGLVQKIHTVFLSCSCRGKKKSCKIVFLCDNLQRAQIRSSSISWALFRGVILWHRTTVIYSPCRLKEGWQNRVSLRYFVPKNRGKSATCPEQSQGKQRRVTFDINDIYQIAVSKISCLSYPYLCS